MNYCVKSLTKKLGLIINAQTNTGVSQSCITVTLSFIPSLVNGQSSWFLNRKHKMPDLCQNQSVLTLASSGKHELIKTQV